MAAYRPPGRSGRSGRSQADSDIFEGLPVKQWSSMPSRVSLAPPPSDVDIEKALDKWADPAMPESSHLLLPHTQQLLRIARSGKYGTKRKAAPDVEPDGDEFNAREDEGVPDEILAKPTHTEEKGFVARKWRQVPDAALVPEHLHWEFLAKRRKGLPSFYHGVATDVSTSGMQQTARRKTRVQKVLDAATGQSVIYEVLALEGQVLENELPSDSQMQVTHLEPGTTIEGLGTADEDGLISLVPSNASAPSRRNRPPPKKKGGPGRGKKRVTFTNPDGSTYTTIVPNATKIVPQPGQTVKHVAKGEDAGKDVSMEEAARLTHEAGDGGDQDEDGDDDEEGDDGDDDDDDREDGEIQEDDAEVTDTPAKTATSAEPTIIDTHPTESAPERTSRQHTPKDNLGFDEPQRQQPVEESKPDTDVEMQDQPTDSKFEADIPPAPNETPALLSEPQPELQPESQSGPQPMLHSEADLITSEEAATEKILPPRSPSKVESYPENLQADDAMDIEPVDVAAPVEASFLSTAPRVARHDAPETKEIHTTNEPPGPALVPENPSGTASISTPQAAEQVLEVKVEPPIGIPESEDPGTSDAGARVEAVVAQDAAPAQSETPLKTFEDGEEDLLGSLERSLET